MEQHAPGRENGAILSSFQQSQMSDGCKILGLQVEASGELQFLVKCCHRSHPSGICRARGKTLKSKVSLSLLDWEMGELS